MTRPLLTLLGPGDPMPEEGQVLVLMDDQVYGKSGIDALAASTKLGESVEAESDGYRLSSSASAALAEIQRVDGHVLFFASDDTHVNTFLRIRPHCEASTMVVHKTLDLEARAALDALGVEYVEHARSMPEFADADIALMCNDIGKEERLFIHHCREHSIPVVSLQEAINMDFDASVMRWADCTMVSGTHALRYHTRRLSYLTGIPRYDDIEPKPAPENAYVLINCNFTYGVASTWARDWLDGAIEAVRRAGLEYHVTMHPRDETDLTGVEHVMDSSAFVVHDQIAGCFALVSRDSSLPYEALLMNRHVVYYNPFHESERCLNEDDTGLIQKCETVDDLASRLTALASESLPLDGASNTQDFFRHYYTGIDSRNYLRVVRALQELKDRGYLGALDAQSDPYVVAWSRMWLQNVLRPRLRAIGWLRQVWKFFKYRVFRYTEN